MKVNTLVSIFAISCLATLVMSASVKKDDSAPKPPTKLFVFREDCYELFFEKLDFTNADCIKFSVSKILGYLIITGAFILKVPQILKILKN
jgi:hypothetical protein